MLTTATVDGTNIVTATYSGALATEEMEQLRAAVRQMIDRDGSVRLLLEYGDIDLGRIEPKAYAEDLKMIGALGDIERIALVTDAAWIRTASQLLGTAISGEVKSFPSTERDEALLWLRD